MNTNLDLQITTGYVKLSDDKLIKIETLPDHLFLKVFQNHHHHFDKTSLKKIAQVKFVQLFEKLTEYKLDEHWEYFIQRALYNLEKINRLDNYEISNIEEDLNIRWQDTFLKDKKTNK